MGLAMLSMQPIGYVRSPYRETRDIPKGLGAKHEAEGVLEIRGEFEAGLTDIEGFSHLFVIWAFDRSEGCTLMATPPSDDSASRRVCDPLTSTSESDRVNCGRTAVPQGPGTLRPWYRHA